ncbi:hypothetical protein EGR_08680 [Echinococcus granulosus]|uniref:Transmembrane protein n=1 Tax=Echinococcus granulosus TaxID=6210 RepID=W6U5N0_ECHGR|nr:hypothetical protein EGR_08680 [Echinococcus granulosus]EUB56458.1 hypothetical protein EGR_08680 [Echinococcus granulosus]
MDTEVPRPKYLHNVQHLPTSPSRDEEAKRTRYRKFLKIRTLVFFALAVCFLSLGIFLLVRYNQPNGLTYQAAILLVLYNDDTWASTGSSVARSCGILFTVLGVAFAITTSVYCPTFIKLIASRSGSVIYHPKSAEALTKMRYPRHKVEKMPPIPPTMATMGLPRVLPPAPFPTGVFVEPSAPPPYSEVEKMQY